MTRRVCTFPPFQWRSWLLWAMTLLMAGCPVYGTREQISGQEKCAEGLSSTENLGAPQAACTCEKGEIPPVGKPLPGVDLTSVPRRGGTLRMHFDSNLPHLMRLLRSDAGIKRIVQHDIMEALVRQDPHDYTYRPELALRWESDESGTVWTFHLRHGVRWHDGTPFTAQDVGFTFDTILNPDNRTEALRTGLEAILHPEHPPEVIDDFTFRITLKRPVFTFLQDIDGIPIIPKHIYGRGDFNTHPRLRSPIGTGPFTFKEWTSEAIVLERNEDYWGRPAYLDRIVYRIVMDRETAFSMLLRGDLDFMPRIMPHQRRDGVTPEVLEKFNRTDHVPAQYGFWVYNTTRPFFSDKRTRQAMSYLIPVDQIICEVYQCLGTRITGPLPPEHPAYDHSLKPYPYDPGKAMKLLDEAGWIDSDGDGIRDKEIDGKRVPFRFTFLLTSSSRTLEQQVTIVQGGARRVGIDIQISKVDWSIFIDRLRNHEFDAASLLWILSPESDPYSIFHAEGGQNYGQWIHQEASDILKYAPNVMNPAVRNAAYRRFHQIVYEEQPYTFTHRPALPGLIRKDFAGVYSSIDYFQEYDIWLNDPSLPEVPPADRHPGHQGAPPRDATGR